MGLRKQPENWSNGTPESLYKSQNKEQDDMVAVLTYWY